MTFWEAYQSGVLNRVVLYVLLMSAMLVMAGCAELEARNQAYAGKDALMACDFSEAVDHFERAYGVLSHNPDVTFGLAVSLLLDTLSQEDVSSVLDGMGFTQDIASFCLDMMAREPSDDSDAEECGSPHESLDSSVVWPHPCLNFNTCSLWDYVDSELRWLDLVRLTERHDARFALMADLFAATASEVDGAYTIEDVLGYKKLTFHAADLYFLSGLMDLARFAIQIASHYELDFSIEASFVGEHCVDRAAYLNRYLCIAGNAPGTHVDIRVFERGVDRLHRAFEEAYTLRERIDKSEPEPCMPSYSLLHWNRVPYGVLDNLITFTASFAEAPYRVTEILYPDVVMDVDAFVHDLPFRDQETYLMTCQDEELISDLGLFIRAINRATTPNLLDESCASLCLSPEIGYRLSSGWRKWSLEELW